MLKDLKKLQIIDQQKPQIIMLQGEKKYIILDPVTLHINSIGDPLLTRNQKLPEKNNWCLYVFIKKKHS